MTRPGARHPRCGGRWRGPLHDDTGAWLVCNACGEQIPAGPGDEEHDMATCTCAAYPQPHPVHCSDCSARRDQCVCEPATRA